jgi:hypothetical protein
MEAGAPLSWTSERLRARKAAADERQPQRAEQAIYMERADASFRLRATTTSADSRCSRRDLQEETAQQRFSVTSAPTKTAATQRTSQRAERAIEQSAMREQLN